MRNSKITPFTKFVDVKRVMFEKTPWYVSFNKGRAEDILQISWDWVQEQPKTSFTKKGDKKLAKQRLKDHIKANYNTKSESLFGGFLLSLIISAIINWIVRQLLDYLFE